MKIKILGENCLYIIHTRDIYCQEEVDKMKQLFNAFDWENGKWLMLPSEYVKKVQVVKR